jgi:ribosome-associated toxin RatA of RatAB toxin-antitoxin module
MNTGGRACARRLVTALILTAGLGLSQRATSAATPDDPPQVDVLENLGVYHVTARFVVSQPATIAYAVLTDYEQIPRFMPAVQTSKVLERGDGHVIVEQTSVVHVLMFSKRVQLLLDIQETHREIRFQDRCGTSFERYAGAWKIIEEDGGTAITYELVSKPTFAVPGSLLKRLFKRDARTMIEGLRAEMAARAARAAHGGVGRRR